MTEGTPEVTGEHFGYAFGAETTPSSADPLSDEFEGDPAPQAPGEEAPPVVEVPATETAPATPAETPAVTEAPPATPATEGSVQEPGEAPPLLAGKYKTVEDLTTAYKHAERTIHQSRQEAAETARKAAAYEAWIRRAMPLLQAQEAAQQQQAQEPQGAQTPSEEFDPTDPAQVQAFIDQRVGAERQRIHQELASTFQQQTQATRQQQMQQALASEIQGFRQAHPELPMDDPLNYEVAQVVKEIQLDPELGRPVTENYPITRQNLEYALQLAKEPQLREIVRRLDLIPDEAGMELVRECAQQPGLYKVLVAQPNLIDTDEGLEFARQQAGLPQVISTAQAEATGLTPEQKKRAAYVEKGGSGAPVTGPPGQRPKDEFDIAMSSYSPNALGIRPPT